MFIVHNGGMNLAASNVNRWDSIFCFDNLFDKIFRNIQNHILHLNLKRKIKITALNFLIAGAMWIPILVEDDTW